MARYVSKDLEDCGAGVARVHQHPQVFGPDEIPVPCADAEPAESLELFIRELLSNGKSQKVREKACEPAIGVERARTVGSRDLDDAPIELLQRSVPI